MTAEHIVKILVSRYGAHAACLTCKWDGPRREDRDEASVDALQHADWMARRESWRDGDG